MAASSDRLIWIDLEMTGLDTTNDSIIEIATIITNLDLETIAEGPVIAIHQSNAVLEAMDEWNTLQHNKSGLVNRVKASEFTIELAEKRTFDFLSKFVKPGSSPMCGNSICQDRRFLAREMPKLESFFHYRNLDVSSLKILASIWAPNIAKSFTKKSTHLALDDIRESIDELRHYQTKFLKTKFSDA
ncbi:MAG: oligoribonuclease [Pseudomonadota bacterium]|nr:oligoribonuclease [Pseudomonadota bacterium]